MDLYQIEETIKELENSPTTFQNCINLSALYIVRNNLKDPAQPMVTEIPEDIMTKELEDIFPAYGKYVDAKRKYQLNQVGKQALIAATTALSIELTQFLEVLYHTSEIKETRYIIEETLSKLLNKFSSYFC